LKVCAIGHTLINSVRSVLYQPTFKLVQDLLVAKPRKLPPRPARLMALESSLRALQMKYQVWLDSMPETLEDSEQAEGSGRPSSNLTQ